MVAIFEKHNWHLSGPAQAARFVADALQIHCSITEAYLVLLSIDSLYIDIISQYNGTQLSITPTMDTPIGGTLTLSGATASISLQQGKTFLVQRNDDLTGFPAV